MDTNKILLQAVLNSKSIGQSDIAKIQKVVDKYHLNLTADIDKAAAITKVRKLVPQLEAELKKITSIDIKINENDLIKAFDQVRKSIAGNSFFPDDIVDKAAELHTEMSRLDNTVNQINLNEALNVDQSQIDQTIIGLNEQLKKNTSYSKEAKDKIHKWIEELEKGEVAEARLKSINSEAKQLHSNMASMNRAGISWSDELENTFSKFDGLNIIDDVFTAAAQKTTKTFHELVKGADGLAKSFDKLPSISDVLGGLSGANIESLDYHKKIQRISARFR